MSNIPVFKEQNASVVPGNAYDYIKYLRLNEPRV